jgi:hypothetical protein
MASPPSGAAVLLPSITCPHCGHRFPPQRLHFIARSANLNYDHRLPEGQMRRFLPTKFTFAGDAFDAGEEVCTETACPECHLSVPRLMAMRQSVSLSIFGSPSSGKSYLLGAMSHTLRRCLAPCRLRFDDVDIDTNANVLKYERQMFAQPSPDHWVYLEKTPETSPDLYSEVWFGPRKTQSGAELKRNKKVFPKPFMYRVEATPGHSMVRLGGDVARMVCLYDNAGEHFQAGGDEYSSVTGHLRDSQGLIFVFDPTQDQQFRRQCRERSGDQQFHDNKVDTQDVLYGNVMNRILTLRSMLPTSLVRVPMVVALTKFDAWRFLLDDAPLPDVWRDVSPAGGEGDNLRVYDPGVVREVSNACRNLLARVAPHVLATIESRCDAGGVQYVPVSATGGPAAGKTRAADWPFSPESPPPDDYDYFLAGSIRPMWTEVPMLVLLHAAAPDLVPAVEGRRDRGGMIADGP